jgi:hypothetical protein
MKRITNATRLVSAKALLIIFLGLASLLLLRPLVASEGKDKEAAKPSVASQKSAIAEAGDLAKRLDSAIDESELGSARWGFR